MLPTFDESVHNKLAHLLASTPLERQLLEDLLRTLSEKQKIVAKEPEQIYLDGAATPSEPEKTSSETTSSEKNVTKVNVRMNMMKKRKIIQSHFDDLEQYYLELKVKTSNEEEMESNRCQFRQSIGKITSYSGLRQVSTFSYSSESPSGLNIVSSIEFNRNAELFTIAGVKKKIQMYDYEIMMDNPTGLHFPIAEMQCNAKISAVHWNTYRTHLLASCDYEGVVQLWDACLGTSTKKFEEHEKRCWSVCFNYMDPNVLASGSDDAKVKLWSINCKDSVATLATKVNVCSVHFNPESRFHLALGSADHCVHYYDLRNASKPLMVLQGHKKAVSYVKYVSGSELVSASTDSSLRLWNLKDAHCTRTFTGHQNEKNFVGLDVKDDFITCGSESSGIFVYYKLLSKPLIVHQFGKDGPNSNEVDGNDFISSVCWKKKSNVLLAANSQGIVKVMELT
uniref:E3 ubiquitin-protein ligase COP1 n=1 Tax=Romanomermis culicivorax TaxID=13658 RepID=A0A915K8D9_ROMCU